MHHMYASTAWLMQFVEMLYFDAFCVELYFAFLCKCTLLPMCILIRFPVFVFGAHFTTVSPYPFRCDFVLSTTSIYYLSLCQHYSTDPGHLLIQKHTRLCLCRREKSKRELTTHNTHSKVSTAVVPISKKRKRRGFTQG